MPHIPRSIAPSSLVDPASVPRAPARSTAVKPAVSFAGTGETPASKKPGRVRNQLMGKLSMKNWDVSSLQIIQQLVDKGVTADEHSGMVSRAK